MSDHSLCVNRPPKIVKCQPRDKKTRIEKSRLCASLHTCLRSKTFFARFSNNSLSNACISASSGAVVANLGAGTWNTCLLFFFDEGMDPNMLYK